MTFRIFEGKGHRLGDLEPISSLVPVLRTQHGNGNAADDTICYGNAADDTINYGNSAASSTDVINDPWAVIDVDMEPIEDEVDEQLSERFQQLA